MTNQVLNQTLMNCVPNQMQATPEMFTPNGNGYDMSPAGMLLLAAHTYYRLKHEMSQDRLDNAKQVMQRILSAARSAGYGRISQLTSALACGECSHRVIKMANLACAKVPFETMRQILAQAKFC